MFTCCLCDQKTDKEYWITHYVGKIKEEILVCKDCAKEDEIERNARLIPYSLLPYKRMQRCG